MSRWTEREMGKVRMALERRNAENTYTLAKKLSKELPRRSVNAVMHKLREVVSLKQFKSDKVILDEGEFPAKIISGYIVITLPDGQSKLAHHYVWEKNFGEIPQGYHIHHISGDRLDNRLINLQLLPADDHIKLHYSSKPPESYSLFCFLQEKGLWKEYLAYRDKIAEMLKE